MIFTTYFAKLPKLPEDIIPISIAVKPPAGYKGLSYSKLFPTEEMVRRYKKTKDEMSYIRYYQNNILNALNPYDVLEDLRKLAGSDKVALVCYEKPGDFCHRHLVAKWLKRIGITVTELS